MLESTEQQTVGRVSVRSVELTSATATSIESCIAGAALFWASLRRVWDPACGVALVITTGAEYPCVAFEISGGEESRVDYLAQLVCNLADAAMVGLTWRVRAVSQRTSSQPLVASFTVESRREMVFTHAPAWLRKSPYDEAMQLRLELIAPLDTDPLHLPSRHGTLDEEGREAIATLALHGPAGPAGVAAAAMLASDLAGPISLTPQWGTPAAPVELPASALHHLLALPARMAGMLPRVDAANTRTLAAVVADLTSPHLLFLGSTGLGKTTTLVHLGGEAIAAGELAVAVDTHDGAFLEKLAGRAHEEGRSVVHVQFGQSDNPVLSITEPPVGVPPDLWTEHLWSLLRHDVWATQPDEYFGPVGEKCVRSLLSLAVRAHGFGLADVSRLIDPQEAAYRESVLAEVNDREATRVLMREILPMVKAGDNAALFVSGKFGQFNSRMFRSATSGAGPRLPLEAALDRGVSVLVHAPASTLGDEPARTLIAALLRRLWVYLTGRAGGPRVNVILDEWHRYASGVAATMLAESRKYGARLILANQVLTQLSPSLRDAALGNAGAIGCFRMSPHDAATMDGLFPTLHRFQLQTLAKHTIALTTFDHDEVIAAPSPFHSVRTAQPLALQLKELGLLNPRI